MRHISVLSMLGLVVGLAGAAAAHDHWVDASDFYPDVGETLEVYLCSGHHFPKSGHALEDKVVEGFRVWDGSGKPRLVESAIGEKLRTAGLAIEHEGVHILGLTLKRPKAKQPAFEARAIVVAGLEDDARRYHTGEGLELIPLGPVSTLRKGDTLSVSLVLDDVPTGGSLNVIPEDGRSFFVKAEADRPAAIPIRSPGRYLLSVQVGARGASLVFMVREGEKTEAEQKEAP